MSNSVVPMKQAEFTPEEMKLITEVIAPGATPKELQLFLHRCKLMGLNPLKPGQIHFVKYGSSPGTIVVGIEGFRALAQRSGLFGGIEREIIRDKEGNCVGARAKVYRKDWNQPAVEEVPLAEYNTGKGPWAKMPETMIKKVAEAAALRMAFPDQLGGVYEQSEMDQAERGNAGTGHVGPEQPGEDDGVQTKEYVVPYGPCAGKAISTCDPATLRQFILDREAAYAKSGRAKGAWFLELLKHAEPLIAEYELNGEPDSAPVMAKSAKPVATKDTETPLREKLNRTIMALYRPYLSKYPETRVAELLQSRYGLGETRLMSVEQLADLVKFMETRLRDELAEPGSAG